jgi:hypothetical protein
MRAGLVMVLGLTALFAAGCISYEQPTAAPTEPPTAAPTEPPPSPPTPAPTEPPTDGPPTPTPDPNATPRPTAVDIAPYLTSEVTVVNLADTPLTLTVALLDPDSDQEYEIGTFEVQPDQVTTQSVIPAPFRLDFGYGGSVDSAGTCTIEIADGEQLQFAVIPEGIAITSNGPEPADPAEMIVATATRCQAGSVE